VNLTRRRGGAEQDAEKTSEKVKRKTSAEGAEDGSFRGDARRDDKSTSAVSVLSGFGLLAYVLRVFLRVSASPRQDRILKQRD
jgi:hypothetical protein